MEGAPIRKESVQDKTTASILVNQLITYFNNHCQKQNNVSNIGHEGGILINQSNGGAVNINIEKLMKTLLESIINDISFYASLFLESESLFQSILNSILLDSFGSKNDIICKWFYTWYNLNCISSKKFVLSFLPALMWVYLTKSHPTNNVLIGLESCLICIYNQEYIKRLGKEKVFNAPNLSLPSYIYKSDDLFLNSVGNINGNSLTESALKLINTQLKPVVLEKPLPRIEYITSANRIILLKTIQSVFTQNILLLSMFSRVIFCEMTTRISSLGYKFIDNIPICERISKINNSKSLLNLSEIAEEDEPSTTATTTTTTTTTAITATNNINNSNLCNSVHYKPIIGLTNYLIHKDDVIKQNNYIEQLSKKRVFLPENIYQEFIIALTLCAFQETTKECAKISAQSINSRASFDLVPEIVLSSNSLLHLLNIQKK
ncbi:hypothetical protein RB653_001719 [Dictyostelium firmibasis]|uniref:Uncharacterized protein n=1 Tax=Dictyostelium firmibasis TaxID=79012 RepID=A0AAN7U4I7_9MYCE